MTRYKALISYDGHDFAGFQRQPHARSVQEEIEKLAFVHENLFSNSTGVLKGLECHEICFYYLMKSHGKQFDYQHNQEQVYWIPLTDLENYKVFPKEITHILKHLQTGIQHIISKKE